MTGSFERGGTGILRGELDETSLAVATSGFKLLWEGAPVTPARLLASSPRRAAALVDELAAAGRAETDDQGRLIGIHGLTLRATRNSFEHTRVVRHTWCAFDSLGIPAALGLDARARTTCPTCGAAVTVSLNKGQVAPSDVVLWLPAPKTTQHLMNDFCATADLYCSIAHLTVGLGTDPTPGRAATLAEAADLGRATWADVTATANDRP